MDCELAQYVLLYIKEDFFVAKDETIRKDFGMYAKCSSLSFVR